MIYKAKMPEAYARVEWCKAQFGGDGEPKFKQTGSLTDYRQYRVVDGLRWWRRQGHLFFREEQDYVFYCLRWS